MIVAGTLTAPETDERSLLIRCSDWMTYSWMNILLICERSL